MSSSRISIFIFSAFAATSPPVPTKILAVTESGGASAFFSNSESQNLITEGNALADKKGASFMTTSANFHQQSMSALPQYVSYFRSLIGDIILSIRRANGGEDCGLLTMHIMNVLL